MKAKIKLDLKNLPIPDKVQLLRRLAESLTDNPNFPAPFHSPANLLAQATQMETKYNDAQTARQIAKSLTSEQNDEEKATDLMLTQSANNVGSTSEWDESKILTTAFAVRNTRVPIGPLPAPDGFVVSPSDHAGAMDVYWNTVRGAYTYLIDRAPDDGGPLVWVQIMATAKSSELVNSMVSGKKYLFRVAAVGPAGQSPWSNPVAKFAP